MTNADPTISTKETSDLSADASRVAEEKLAYLAAVVDASSDAILTKSLDGTITSWNGSAERIFGYTSREIVGKNIRRLIPDELQDEEDEILAKLRAGRYVDHFETVRLTKDGRRLDVSLSISPIRNRANEVIGASKILRDITARKRAEEQLAAATAKFESVFNQSGIFAGIMDLAGNLIEINTLALEWCGYTREQVIGRPFWSTRWWSGSTETQERIRQATQAAAEGEVFRETLPYWLVDGTERIVEFALHPIRDESGEVRFLYPTGIDVTERVRAQEVLQAREAEEREIALGLQRALLPARLVAPAGVSLSGRYEAGSDALEVGGDWYDAFVLSDGRLAVTVGDVVGHGLPAAAAMGQLRTALAAMAEHAGSAGELLAQLDGFLARSEITDFATVFYGVLDPSTGRFEFASAGHPPMLIVSAEGDVRRLDNPQSSPLCGLLEQERPHAATTLEPGSLLVMYTDGLIERRGESLKHGIDRLEEAVKSLAGAPIVEVCDALFVALGVDTSRDDDIAVLAVRIEPTTTAAFHRSFPARAEEPRGARKSMRSWLDKRPIPVLARNALLLAVGEACSNAIEHAYRDQPTGRVEVDIEEQPGSLSVTVRDHGRFLDHMESTGDRGHGTGLMQSVTSSFTRESTRAGTRVRFHISVDELLER